MRKIYVVTDLASGSIVGAWAKLATVPDEYSDTEFYLIEKVVFKEE